ncbi:MAG TPA: glycoside hydrolase family 15 protein [Myxococcota bacterium]|nr:glycoside hydrolase family 15 protein [Myxococcota bacterium]
MRYLEHMLGSLSLLAIAATPLVTGNGHGFAVYGEDAGALVKLYAHPYSFTRQDPRDALAEGIPTTNFVKRLGWDDPGKAEVSYREQSHVIVRSSGHSTQSFFMPWGLERHVLVTTWESNAANVPPLVTEWAHTVATRREVQVEGATIRVSRFHDVDEVLVTVPLGPRAWAFASLENESDAERAAAEILRWAAALDARALVERELREIEAWRVKPAVTFASDDERALWRQSEMVLRMGQSREPNRPGRVNNGLILAALPDGGWVTYWVRDMAYAIDALIRMGHRAEARAGIEAYFHARPIGAMHNDVGGLPYQVSVVRYFGDGAEEPFFTQEGATNIELDNWGLVLWVLGDYVARFGDDAILDTPTYRGSIYESAKRYIVDPLIKNLDVHDGGLITRADTSIWEERQKDAKHFAYSTIAAIVGLGRFDALAQRRGDAKLHGDLLGVLSLLRQGFDGAYAKDHRLRGTLERGIKNDIDGAVLTAFNFEVVTDRDVMKNTVDAMARLAVASGGYRRVTCILTDPKIFEYWYERQEFVFVDLSLAEVYRRLGEKAKADALLGVIVSKAARDHFFVPEMYVSVGNPLFKGPIGAPTGAIPMVGYGAGAYISHLLARERM